MSEKQSTAALVDRLIEAGMWPTPVLVRGIVARGAEAVGEIAARLRTCIVPSPARSHLLGMLTLLPGGGAVPELVQLLRSEADEELLPRALVAQGAAAVGPLLGIVRAETVAWYNRGLAAQLALACTAEDAGLREQVCGELRELLQSLLARREQLSSEDRSFAGSLVLDLAQLPDRSAVPLLTEAVAAGLCAFISPHELERLLAAPPNPGKPLDWLAEYQEQYDERDG